MNTAAYHRIPPALLGQIPTRLQVELKSLPYHTQKSFFTHYVERNKSTRFAYLLWVAFGLHYAYVNQWGTQFLFWLTAGGLGVWWFIDLFRIPKTIRQYNHTLAANIFGMMRLTGSD